jgi:hypothetical protein
MTALVTCDQLIASFTSSLENASASQIAALSAALAAAGVSGGASGAAGGGLTGTYPNPGLNAAAVNAAITSSTITSALAASGVGTGAFIAQTAGVSIANSTETTLASWTAPKTGVIAATFSFAAQTNSATQQLLVIAKIFKGATQVAGSGNTVGDSDSEIHNAFAETNGQYITVNAGDVITGKAFVGADPAVGSTTLAATGVGLSLHYISVA